MSVAQLRLKASEAKALTRCVQGVVALARNHNIDTLSVIPLPRTIKRFTVLRSPHVYKKAREQFQSITHTRLITLHAGGNTLNLLHLIQAVQHGVFPGVQVQWMVKAASVATSGS